MIRNILVAIVICAVVAQSFALVFHRSLRSADTCGVAKIQKPLIVQGESFARGTFPWIVALMHIDFQPPKFFCAGTLISRSFVISAAHCMADLLPRHILAFFGTHDLENLYEPGRFALSPREIFLHPQWNPRTTQYDGDLALLEFEDGNLIFTDFVQPICFWKSESELNETQGIVTGWGWSGNLEKDHENIPKMITASIQTNEDCWLEEERLLKLSSKRTFCAGSGDGSAVCAGDSGGGLFIKIDGVYHLKGIVSTSLTGEIGCDVSVKAVYSNVPKYKDWIEDMTEKMMKTKVAAFCSYGERRSSLLKKTAKHCDIKDKISGENYFLGPPIDTSCEVFYIRDNKKDVKYLPRQIGEILPNLKEVNVESCGLTIIRDFYFKNMRKLRVLNLDDNDIVTIEPNAFKDLVKVETMWLKNNLIQTLDEKLFASMTNLEHIYLTSNKIKFLSPATFKIPGAKLIAVDLRDNICIHQIYNTPEQRNRIESDLRSQCSRNAVALTPQILKNVICSYSQVDSIYLNRTADRCLADQKIESEDYFFTKEPMRDDVEIFFMAGNKYVKFLPKNIGEKFPNLKEFDARQCGLTIIRDFYFKNMRNLKFLILNQNKIATIETGAFKDLVSLEILRLHYNLIETLDEKLFALMTGLKKIYLNNNKIKFLSPETFKISSGFLDYVDLRGNACIGKFYRSNWESQNLNKLESDLKAECSQN